jgi:hypothetical protein
VGYGEGGLLTEAVRQRPYSVVLLDEVEKADPEVMEVFYQVFDKGMLSDGEGREIDFKNTVIFLTSNLATDVIMSMAQGPVRPMPTNHQRHPPRAEPALRAGGAHDALLSDLRRGHEGDHSLVNQIGQRLAPQDMFEVIRRRPDRAALHGSRHRRPQHRPHPERKPAPAHLHRAAGADGGRGTAEEVGAVNRCRRGFQARFFVEG